ncbi:MAG TPA: SpoIVB peptidase S55 domain-containing protein, partial [bacterium]|nr:SpoIVB peptidase S55 domain-containing protein [bacterium]HPI76667.1 SpoIVB peptidase S55 domain-containing protein [bacterium]
MIKNIAAAVCSLVLFSCAALSAVAKEKFGVPIMTVDEVRPGMKGYGLTVFKGAEPEKFDIEVVAVIKKWRTGNDLIIVRCSGKNLEFTGIAAGMSGSPMYIDDRLIGALAYGWYWPKEAIAGVQPIEHMFELWEMPEAKGSAGKAQESGRSAAPFSFLNLRGEETTAALKEIK